MSTSVRAELDDEQRWEAVCRRDASQDGAFVYAVRTTGVYCRPSCPSRLARRRNTAFFPTAADAEASGYRACKRCLPDVGAMEHPRARLIRDVCTRLEQSTEMPVIDELAGAFGLSASHLRREFKRLTGLTPREYVAGIRRERLQVALRRGQPVADAIYEAGYGSGSRVYESAGQTLGMTPAQYRDGAPEIPISFTIAETELGHALVAATGKGVCCIELGDDENGLAESLRRRFPAARLVRDSGALEGTVRALARFLVTPAEGLSLPLDIQGTAFQRRVWKALRAIPAGRTATYGEIAAAIGSPRAYRAVARACAENRLAVAIPCHRAIRADGGLGGYRWGLERKQRLLERERSAESDADEP